MLISYWKVSIPFLDDAKLPKQILVINFKFLCIFEGVIVEKLKGGSGKVEILVACN